MGAKAWRTRQDARNPARPARLSREESASATAEGRGRRRHAGPARQRLNVRGRRVSGSRRKGGALSALGREGNWVAMAPADREEGEWAGGWRSGLRSRLEQKRGWNGPAGRREWTELGHRAEKGEGRVFLFLFPDNFPNLISKSF